MLMILQNLENFEHDNEKTGVIRDLLRAHLKRHHYIALDRYGAKYLKGLVFSSLFNPDEKNTLIKLIGESIELKALTSKINLYIKIDFSTTEDDLCSDTYSYLSFYDTNFSQPLQLICENKKDCSVYNYWGYLELEKINRNNQFDLQSHYVPGGGNTIDECYQQKLKENFLSLCISDSDKTYPEAPLGETAKGVFKVNHKKNKSNPSETIIHECHELENLIPLQTYLLLLGNNLPSDLGALYKRYNNNEFYVYLKYIDMKEGLSRNEVNTNKNTKFKKFWNEFLTSCEPDKVETISHKFGDCITKKIEQVFEDYKSIEKYDNRKRKDVEKKWVAMKQHWYEYPHTKDFQDCANTILCYSIAPKYRITSS